jgi:hypothetical protein
MGTNASTASPQAELNAASTGTQAATPATQMQLYPNAQANAGLQGTGAVNTTAIAPSAGAGGVTFGVNVPGDPGINAAATAAANTIGGNTGYTTNAEKGGAVTDPSSLAGQSFNSALAQLQAPPVSQQQTVGAGQFQLSPAPPPTVATPPPLGYALNYNNLSPYLTAQTNEANQQTYSNLSQGLGLLGTGSNAAQQDISTLGASESQQIQTQLQNSIGQNDAQMAESGLTGSTVGAAMNAQAQRTANLAQTALVEQVGTAQAQVAVQGAGAMANYLAAPSYNNDNSTLLSAATAMSNYSQGFVNTPSLGTEVGTQAASAGISLLLGGSGSGSGSGSGGGAVGGLLAGLFA